MPLFKEPLEPFLACNEEPLRKVSGKRCLSPVKPCHQQLKRHSKRKTNNPILILSQHNSLEHSLQTTLQQSLYEEEERIRRMSQTRIPDPNRWEDEKGEVENSIIDSDNKFTKTENDVATEILDSFNSLDSTSIPWPQDVSSVRDSFGSSYYSSSYTSWTRPEAGHRISDSCIPNSSILDKDPSCKPINRSRSVRRSKKWSGRGLLKRDSSADTSKDIDDIEDLELDEGLDELLHDDEDDCNVDAKRSSSTLLMESPDLAYASMNPSADELSK